MSKRTRERDGKRDAFYARRVAAGRVDGRPAAILQWDWARRDILRSRRLERSAHWQALERRLRRFLTDHLGQTMAGDVTGRKGSDRAFDRCRAVIADVDNDKERERLWRALETTLSEFNQRFATTTNTKSRRVGAA